MTKDKFSWSRTKKEKAEMTGEELAEYLAKRLEYLDFVRKGAVRLMARDQLGRDYFSRGETEFVSFSTNEDLLKDFLIAYFRMQNNRFKPKKSAAVRRKNTISEGVGDLPLFRHTHQFRRY